MKFYTNVFQRGNYLYVRGIDNGERFSERVEFYPTVWMNAERKASDEWKTLFGESVYSFNPGNINETKKYIEENKDIRVIYSTPGNPYEYITRTYPGEIKWGKKYIKVFTIDIETEAEGGFPDPKLASEELLLITIKDAIHDKTITFGRRPYTPKNNNNKYVLCETEESLIRSFISWWQSNYPDIITGWNSSLFDLTYLYNRIMNVLGEVYAVKLSPWKYVYQREIKLGDRVDQKTTILGIACLDYMDLYKKFTYTKQENYKLDHIAFIELGEKKLENPEPVFRDFYRKHWDLFCDYNIHDVGLVDRLDAKLKLIDLALTIAYDAKANYEDVFSPVKTWDLIIYNYLHEKKVVIPVDKASKKSPYEGGYVKKPLIGKHNWVITFDLNSLYPHLIMGYNLSPETITHLKLDVNVEDLLEKKCDLQIAYDHDYAVASSGNCFTRKEKGLLPTLMQLFYDRRVIYKKEMLKCKQEYENNKTPELENEIARLNNLQMAMKILLNAAYGAFGNNFFRYYDIRIAESITLSGQLAIRWIGNKLNGFMQNTMKDDKDRVVLIDTDSVILTMEDLINSVCKDKSTIEKIEYMDKISEKVIQPFIDKSYQELAEYTNAFEQKMKMKRENLIDTMVSVAKKNYVMSVYNSEGVQYKEPKLKIMGLQMIKSSTPLALKEKLKDSLKIILYGDQETLQNYVFDYKDEFMKLTPEEIAFPRGVTELSKYHSTSTIYGKGSPIHVRSALLYNHYLKKSNLTHKYPIIKDGDKIKFIYLIPANPIGEDCIAFVESLPEEFDLHKFVDYNLMYEKTFQDAIQNVVEPLGWSTQQISTLEDWFE